MNFRNVIKEIYAGRKAKLPEWKGYWYLGSDNLIWVHTFDRKDVPTPHFITYADRNDWLVND